MLIILVKLNCILANNELRTRVISLATTLLEDGHITVRQKAAKILGGLLHSGFVCDDTLTELLARLRSKVRTKMTRKGRKFKKETQQLQPASDREKVTLHSGILGLCAFVEAFPYDVPSFLPPILMELSTHLNDPQVGVLIISEAMWQITKIQNSILLQPVPMAIKKTLQEFKRTHQDNWQASALYVYY